MSLKDEIARALDRGEDIWIAFPADFFPSDFFPAPALKKESVEQRKIARNAEIADRHSAGERISALAREYGLSRQRVLQICQAEFRRRAELQD